jgi:hypothetical protein
MSLQFRLDGTTVSSPHSCPFSFFKCNTSRCNDPCPVGKHGSECKSECRCQNSGTCDPETGKCFCEPGWTGPVCANRCPFGFWGEKCSQPCGCYNGASCHHVTGKCECQPGFMGEKVSVASLHLI